MPLYRSIRAALYTHCGRLHIGQQYRAHQIFTYWPVRTHVDTFMEINRPQSDAIIMRELPVNLAIPRSDRSDSNAAEQQYCLSTCLCEAKWAHSTPTCVRSICADIHQKRRSTYAKGHLVYENVEHVRNGATATTPHPHFQHQTPHISELMMETLVTPLAYQRLLCGFKCCAGICTHTHTNCCP